MCTLLNRGIKISHIGQLRDAQVRDQIDHIIEEPLQTDQHVEAWINQALIAIAACEICGRKLFLRIKEIPPEKVLMRGYGSRISISSD